MSRRTLILPSTPVTGVGYFGGSVASHDKYLNLMHIFASIPTVVRDAVTMSIRAMGLSKSVQACVCIKKMSKSKIGTGGFSADVHSQITSIVLG